MAGILAKFTRPFAIPFVNRKKHFVCYQFFKQIRAKYGHKPIHTDSAFWYNEACRWLGLKHIIYETKLKNIMERFIQIKDRQNVSMITFYVRKEVTIEKM